jgi:predicted amidohydrolase
MSIRIAICQILTSHDVAASTDKIIAWMDEAVAGGADVAVFPEVATAGYPRDAATLDVIGADAFRTADARLVDASRRLNLATVVGTARPAACGGWHNSLLIVDKGGCVRGYYDKLHPAEAWAVPGGCMPIHVLCGVPSCFIVCYDWRFPELTRLYAAAGAKVCYCCAHHEDPSVERKTAAYHAIPVVRAAENGFYFVSANAPGCADNLRAGSHGRSRIIDPDGNVLATGSTFGEELIMAEIDPDLAKGSHARRALNDNTPLRMWLGEGIKIVQQDAQDEAGRGSH